VGTNNRTYALEVYDDGSGAGPQLYASGGFWMAGGSTAHLVARWDGTNWSDLDFGLTGGGGIAEEMTVFDDGSGAKLYVGGSFGYSGTNGNAAENIAAWDGTHWLSPASSQASTACSSPWAPTTTARANALIGGGAMTRTGDVAVNSIAAWDGTSWSALVQGTGVDRTVFALASHDDGHGRALYAGGDFLDAGDQVAARIAKVDGGCGLVIGRCRARSVPTDRPRLGELGRGRRRHARALRDRPIQRGRRNRGELDRTLGRSAVESARQRADGRSASPVNALAVTTTGTAKRCTSRGAFLLGRRRFRATHRQVERLELVGARRRLGRQGTRARDLSTAATGTSSTSAASSNSRARSSRPASRVGTARSGRTSAAARTTTCSRS
jgi:hypothetical protein